LTGATDAVDRFLPQTAADNSDQAMSDLFDIDTVRRSFELRVSPVMPDLLRYFARRVKPEEDAYDCLSETLIVLWQKRSRLPNTEDQFRAWSFGVARKVLANHVRAQSRRVALRDRATRYAGTAQPHAEDSEALETLSGLNKTDQELVRLIVWDGFGVAEAGALLGLKAATARTRYSRAKAQLKRDLA
jgi:RNA polymerase sigma-70 factor (ECF subfamily)